MDALKKNDIEQLKVERTSIEDVILNRRSVRMYKKEQVPEFMIKRILEAGRFAPSACNCQPWKFIVLREPEIIQGITNTTVNICKTFKSLIDYRIPGKRWRLPLAKLNILIKPNDLHPSPFGFVSLVADGKSTVFHGAPTVILIFKDVRGVGSPDLDCGIAGQNMVLAAHSMGLGTCWISIIKVAFDYSRKWKKYFNINYPFKFVSSMTIGWPVGKPDVMIQRPTHAVQWYENGSKNVIY